MYANTTWKNYYEILQVSPNADSEIIEAAYRRLAKKHHPDVGGDPETMKLINEAYAVLRDPDERMAYDNVYFAQTEAGAGAHTEAEMQAAIFAEMIRARPWPRLLARFVDAVIWGAVLMLIAVAFIPYPSWFWLAIESILVYGLIASVSWIPIEAALLSAFGATPGKRLLRIRVVTADGGTLWYLNALKRSFGVFVWGLGLGIPIVQLICMYSSYGSLRTWGFTKWDAWSQSIVLHESLGLPRVLVAVIIVVGLFVLYFAELLLEAT